MVIVAPEAAHYDSSVPCKTSLIFSTIHEQGALARCIAIFADRGLNLTKIESRPKPDTPFEYIFYMDFEGNIDREATQAALQDLDAVTTFLVVLGSYPIGRAAVS
jgi:chorismate mutase/prephenate dehydratase